MRPTFWRPPVALSPCEQIIITQIKRAKLFVFLRHHRHEIFDEAFQEELAALYAPSHRGHPPISPAQLALATLLQAYTGVSDDEGDRGDADGSALAVGAGLFRRRSGTI
jgi:hypothetical protein